MRLAISNKSLLTYRPNSLVYTDDIRFNCKPLSNIALTGLDVLIVIFTISKRASVGLITLRSVPKSLFSR
jgi:hypothetical protein